MISLKNTSCCFAWVRYLHWQGMSQKQIVCHDVAQVVVAYPRPTQQAQWRERNTMVKCLACFGRQVQSQVH